jgi:hypothetical protein
MPTNVLAQQTLLQDFSAGRWPVEVVISLPSAKRHPSDPAGFLRSRPHQGGEKYGSFTKDDASDCPG